VVLETLMTLMSGVASRLASGKLTFGRISFFFQAEDGIRDRNVTGVRRVLFRSDVPSDSSSGGGYSSGVCGLRTRSPPRFRPVQRSEERRVGKDCSSRWARGEVGQKCWEAVNCVGWQSERGIEQRCYRAAHRHED